LTPFDEIVSWFATPQAQEFYGERVTIAEHMLQAAALAVSEQARTELVAAALLHDVGHLVPDLHPDERNREHANLALNYLSEMFSSEVTEPIRLHVQAKRFLVATQESYEALLSPASVHTLKLQGGPLDASGCETFLEHPHAQDALMVRRWDEAAKDAEADVPDLDAYRELVESLT
jgi:gamma-butyrobetaine dioxygenase